MPLPSLLLLCFDLNLRFNEIQNKHMSLYFPWFSYNTLCINDAEAKSGPVSQCFP